MKMGTWAPIIIIALGAQVSISMGWWDPRVPILTWQCHRFLPTSDHADRPWGAMPFLEMEETTRIGGSHVILRFLGKKFGKSFSTAGHDASGHVVWALCTSSLSFASPLQVWLGLMMWRMHRLQQQSMLSLTLWRKFPRSCLKKMRRERYLELTSHITLQY